jgi:hypothetical protein
MADKLNPDEILEILEVDSEELLEYFEDKVEARFEELAREYGDSEETETDL